MMNKTVIEYVLDRLYQIGIHDIFGVAGDYAFPIEDAVCESEKCAGLATAMNLMPHMLRMATLA